MKLDPKIIKTILEDGSPDPKELSKRLSRQFQRFIPPTVIATVLETNQRKGVISEAKDLAAKGLNSNIALMFEVSEELKSLGFSDELEVKDRISALKELRLWTDLNIKTTGLYDEEGDKLFVIDGEWALE